MPERVRLSVGDRAAEQSDASHRSCGTAAESVDYLGACVSCLGRLRACTGILLDGGERDGTPDGVPRRPTSNMHRGISNRPVCTETSAVRRLCSWRIHCRNKSRCARFSSPPPLLPAFSAGMRSRKSRPPEFLDLVPTSLSSWPCRLRSPRNGERMVRLQVCRLEVEGHTNSEPKRNLERTIVSVKARKVPKSRAQTWG